MKVTREIKTAILAIVAIGLVIYGYNFMKGQNIFDSSRDFYAVYDNVEGLSNSADVTINGLKVGSISSVDFLNDNGQIVVKFSVDNNFEFSKFSKATIYSNSLIGGKSLKIEPDYKGALAKPGDTLGSAIELEMMESLSHRVEPLEQKLENALEGIDSLVSSFNEIVDDDSKENIKQSLAHLNTTLKHLNSTTSQLDMLISNNTDKLDGMIADLDHTSHNFKSFSDSLAQVEVKPLLQKVDSSLANIQMLTMKLASGEGTIGKLFTDDQVYDNVDNATREMEELIQDIKLNPGRYINLKFSLFGGKNKIQPYQEPIKD